MNNNFFKNAGLTELLPDDMVETYNEIAEGKKGLAGESLERYKPEGARVKIYLDLDGYFLVLYPVVSFGGENYYINQRSRDYIKSDPDIEIFMFELKIFLGEYKIRPSKYFPALLTMPAVYTDDILDFFLEAIPLLAKVATIYYTANFKKMMIKKSLKLNISCAWGRIDQYLEFEFSYDAGISPDELAQMMDAVDKGEELRFFQLKRGGFIDLREDKIAETLMFLKKFGVTPTDLEKRKINMPKCEIPYAAGLIEEAEAKKALGFTGPKIKSIEKRLFDIKEKNLALPKTIKASLRPYQEDGYRWLKTLMHTGLGGILADDMGLGKTLQAIALILSVFEEKARLKALIVVPTSLIDNWVKEFNRFAPSINCVALCGDTEARKGIYAAEEDYHVFITSYGLVLNDLEALKETTFDILVLDEAQRIKNRLSKTAKAVSKIKANNKFALTGTPVENNLAELWSIFNWLIPPLLKDFESFKRKYIDTWENMDELKAKIRPFVLRRMKKDVLKELPEKTETTIKIELTDTQKKLYLAYREQALQLLEEPGQMAGVLAKLTRLRQICCHPGMFMDDYREPTGKLEVLLDMIGELRGQGRRVLVFSQFTSMLDIIKVELDKNNIGYSMLDGRTPQKLRGKVINNFIKGAATVFLISLKAGGTGLNLTAADTVIHCDPWWNPSVEEQASARSFRLGQEKCVQIIYLIAKGTIEERINDVKQQKKELIERLIEPGGQALTSLSAQELRQFLG